RWTAQTIDPATHRRAASCVRDATVIAHAGAEAPELDRALEVLASLDLPMTDWAEILEASGLRVASFERQTGRLLRERGPLLASVLSPRAILQLGGAHSLRELVVAALAADPAAWATQWKAIEDAADDAPRQSSAAELFDRWVVASLVKDSLRFLALLDRRQLVRALAAVRRHRDATAWLKAYCHLPDHRSAALALDDLEAAWRPRQTHPAPHAP